MAENRAHSVALCLLHRGSMRWMFLSLPVALVGVLMACGGSTSNVGPGGASADGGGDACEKCGSQIAPVKHRAAAETCGTDRPTTEPNIFYDGGAGCHVNADCTEGRDGRCRLGRAGAYCTYNECTTDSECTSGVCQCGDPNACKTAGDCRVDSDCGAGGYCSPSFGDCGDYNGTIGWFCHRANDECVDDKDCTDGSVGGYCAFEPTEAKWKCSNSQCAG